MHNSDILIREASIDDAKYISYIEDECFSLPWSEKSLSESMALDNYIFLLAVVDYEISGYIGLYIAIDEGDITNIAVKEKYRKQGIANKLLEVMIERCKQRKIININLEVRESNFAAIKLYEKFGFENLGIRKNFYEKPLENAMIMQKHI